MLARTVPSSALLLCLLAAASAQQIAPPVVQQVPLEPFAEIDSCVPVNLLIKPNSTAEVFDAIVEAEQAVVDALSFLVADSVLSIETTANFSTSRPIKVTIAMPQGALQAINHQGTGAEVFVAPGFVLPSFTATTAFGAGRLYVDGMSAQEVTLLASGTGDTVLIGSFGTVNATTTGTGGLYIAGANETVQLELRGVSNAFVQPAGPGAAITGTAQGINTVQYTDGTCDVASSFVFLQVCQSVPFLAIPAANPVWTCGLAVQGAFSCSNEGTAFTSSAGFVGTSGAEGTTPVTTTTPTGVSAFTPSSFQFAGASPAGTGTGTQQQAGSVTPGITTASSNVAGTGSVSASSTAGPGGAQTSTTQNEATTGFQTTGQRTGGFTGGAPATGGAMGGGGATSSASASSSSTAFSTASPSSNAAATSSSQPAGLGGDASAGVIRVGANGASQATATSLPCMALAFDLRMPFSATP